MAQKRWKGTAPAVAQVESGSIDSVDVTPSNNDFTITIGGASVTVAGDTDVTTTADALVLAANNATDPAFSGVTWTNNAGTITATADVAGLPMASDPVLSETGAGTGAVTDFTNSAACAGPHHWDTAANWEPSGVPVNADEVTIEGVATSILYGLDQNAVTLALLDVRRTFTGKIGLNLRRFVTALNGETSVDTKNETREDYLRIGWDRAEFGQHIGSGQPAGSSRIKAENTKSGASTTVVHETANQTAESGFPALRLKFAHADADVVVRGARRGVGIAMDAPDETSTVGDVLVQSGSVYLGNGVTVTNVDVAGGTVAVQAAATVTSLSVDGGTVTTEGDFTITTVNANGGTLRLNHRKTSGDAVGTLNIDGGGVDFLGSKEARTVNVLNHNTGRRSADDGVVTFTTINEPTGAKSIEIADAA